jgi:mono/diheme cytochrome c family protein
MKTVFTTVLTLIILGAAGAAAFVYAGVYNIAATDPHWRITYWIMDTARVRSIKTHAEGISIPAGFDDQAKIVAAAGHYGAHCATCHGGPGIDRDEFVAGMYPKPPTLTDAGKRYTAAELFWILKSGIKMSGMPSMADDGDDMLWSTVGFLEKLPRMSPDDYNALWMESQAQAGAHDHKAMPRTDMDRNQEPTPAGQRRDTDQHDH